MSVERAKFVAGTEARPESGEAQEERAAPEKTTRRRLVPPNEDGGDLPRAGKGETSHESGARARGRQRQQEEDSIAEEAVRKKSSHSAAVGSATEMAAERRGGEPGVERAAGSDRREMARNGGGWKSEKAAVREEVPRIVDTAQPIQSAPATAKDLEAFVRQVMEREGSQGVEQKKKRAHTDSMAARAAGIESRLRRLELRLKLNRE